MSPNPITIGVLALQGAFSEHLQLLRAASASFPLHTFIFIEVRTPHDLSLCSALILPGGESTTISLIASRSSLLEPLRAFVKLERKLVWGTCAGMILLAEQANRTKKGGQDLIGGLDVAVERNHFGRQRESFNEELMLRIGEAGEEVGFMGVFIRAPVVERVLGKGWPRVEGVEKVVAPQVGVEGAEVEVLGRLRRRKGDEGALMEREMEHDGEVVAVRQGNCVGTSFHPELTGDARMHRWWLGEVLKDLERRGR